MWVLMSVVGFIKGFMRFDSSFYEYNPIIQNFLYFLPVLGLVLFVAISILCIELLQVLLKPNKALINIFTPLETEKKTVSKVAFLPPLKQALNRLRK